MTVLGYERLKTELSHLKKVERPNISKAIEEARAHGDLSENAEYHAAKEKQSFIEGRIREVESKLALSDVIDPSKLTGDKVVFGATVTFVDVDTDEEASYQIVGVDEADLKEKKISFTSPMARALIGKRVGEEVKLRLPKGEKELEIMSVDFC